MDAQLATEALTAGAQGMAAAAVSPEAVITREGMVILLVPSPTPPGHGGYDGKMPPRADWLHPLAQVDYERIQDSVVVSDKYRSAESSFVAMQKKSGVLPPGRSRHGFGLAIDVSVAPSMKLVGVKTKEAFDDWMASRNWHCHRLDHAMQPEAWHYNWLPDFKGVLRNERSTNPAGERQLMAMYGEHLAPGPVARQRALAKVGLYRGDDDGVLGPLSIAAGQAFCRAWKLPRLWAPDMLRTLAFVAAELRTPDGRLIVPAKGIVEARP